MDESYRRPKGKLRQQIGFKRQKVYKSTVPRGVSGTTAQAMRTGGWSNPSKMGELKFVDVGTRADTLTASVTTFTTPGAVFLLNGIVPGSGADQRIGRVVTGKSIYVRGVFSMGATSTSGSPLRILIVYDKQANATAFNTTDLLKQDDFRSGNNLSNRDRFTVIADMITPYIGSGDKVQTNFEIYKKLNLETQFNAGTAGSIGDITSGSIYIMFAHFGIATAGPVVNWWSRYRYRDV